MKVKGIVTQKYDKSRNLHRGDVIELTPEEKAVEAVKSAVSEMSVPGETMCWSEGTDIPGPVSLNANGEKFHGKYTNGTYRVSGKVVIRTLDVKTDRLKPIKESDFDLVFCDCLDALNQPDLKVESFNIK